MGVSFHVGSGCSSANSYADAIQKSKFLFDYGLKYGVQMKILDIGGGFIQKEPLLTQVSEALQSSLHQFFGKNNLPQLIGEPGRFMAANVYDLSVPVIGKKRENDRMKYYIANSVYSSFNCKIFDYAQFNYDIHKVNGEVLSNQAQPENVQGVWTNQRGTWTDPQNTTLSTVFGATCDSLDLILEDQQLPELEIGDRLFFHNMGAYTLSASSKFNGIAKPLILYHD